MDNETLEKLEKLASLLERGVITKDEMEAQKAVLLGRSVPNPRNASRQSPAVVSPEPRPLPEAPVDPYYGDAQSETGGVRSSFKWLGLSFALFAFVAAIVGGGLYYQSTQRQMQEMKDAAEKAEAARKAEESARYLAEQSKLREEEARLAAEAAYRAEEENRRLEAKKPKFAAVVTRCDSRCSGFFSDCTYVECHIKNVGGSYGIAYVDVSTENRIDQKSIVIGPGDSGSVSANFEGISGSSCKCTVTRSEVYSE